MPTSTHRTARLAWNGLLLMMLSLLPAFGNPGYGPSLDRTTGTIYRVGTVSTLQNAFNTVNAAGIPATILVSNGTYVLTDWALPITCDHVIVRSLSGNRENVIIRGPDEGPSATAEHIFWVQGSDVTIADLAFGFCLYHGVQAHGQAPYNVSNLLVHNCHIINCNEQFIKGTSATGDPEGVTDSTVAYCLFEFTNQWAYQYYTGGIDIHKAVNWHVHDNRFKYIRNPSGGIAEHAIHFWNRCTSRPQNVIVERNLIFNCDRGIGFGLGGYDSGLEGGNSYIRNNFVYSDGAGPNSDVGIGLESARDVTVANNTVYHETYWAPIEYRFVYSSNLVFQNNLVNRAIRLRDSAPPATMVSNVESVMTAWFPRLTNGDLRLSIAATGVIDCAVTAPGFTNDILDAPRPRLAAWDVGAHEYDPGQADSDGDHMTDAWEQRYDLDPLDASDAAEDPDSDGEISGNEWIADTDPHDSNDVFRIQQMGISNSSAITCRSSTGRLYSLDYSDTSFTNWLPVASQQERPGETNRTILYHTNTHPSAVYRVRAGPFF